MAQGTRTATEENNNIKGHSKYATPKYLNTIGFGQSRLVRLLSSDSFVESGLCLAQLPKEYEKNYPQQKVPNPKEYGYHKLIQLLRKYKDRLT